MSVGGNKEGAGRLGNASILRTSCNLSFKLPCSTAAYLQSSATSKVNNSSTPFPPPPSSHPLQDMFNLLPNMSAEHLSSALAVKSNDMMAVVYLAALIR